jgi:hypothetical protein
MAPFSLGVTLDQCTDGLLVKTIDRRGALGRSGRVVCLPVLGPRASVLMLPHLLAGIVLPQSR